MDGPKITAINRETYIFQEAAFQPSSVQSVTQSKLTELYKRRIVDKRLGRIGVKEITPIILWVDIRGIRYILRSLIGASVHDTFTYITTGRRPIVLRFIDRKSVV